MKMWKIFIIPHFHSNGLIHKQSILQNHTTSMSTKGNTSSIAAPQQQHRVILSRCTKDSVYSCAICLAIMEKGSWVRHLPCSHTFHSSCIRKQQVRTTAWNNKCPLCRQEIPPTKTRTSSYVRNQSFFDSSLPDTRLFP